jgi:hypothetical protein
LVHRDLGALAVEQSRAASGDQEGTDTQKRAQVGRRPRVVDDQ